MKTVCADLISLSPFFKMQKKIAVDETLWRVYFGSYKSPLTTRAGLPHRRIFEFRNVLILLSNCPCNYSLLSFRKLLKDCFTVQSINSDGIFSLQKNPTLNHCLYCWLTKLKRPFLFQLNIDIVCFYQLCAAHSHCKKSICFHSRSNHGVDFPMYLCGRGHLGHYIRWFVSEIFALVTFIPKLSVGALILWDQDSALMANFRTQSSVNLLRWYFFLIHCFFLSRHASLTSYTAYSSDPAALDNAPMFLRATRSSIDLQQQRPRYANPTFQ
jgi:hypothetical protein